MYHQVTELIDQWQISSILCYYDASGTHGGAMTQQFSEHELLSFLEYMGEKGLLNPATARSRKIAAERVLSALDDHEKVDLRTLDLDDAFQRFVNKNAKEFTPGSLSSYQSRFKGAIADFLRYVQNPTAFRPTVAARTARGGESPAKPSGQATTKRRDKQQSAKPVDEIHRQHSGTFIFPVPLRQGVVVQLHGIPTDLTKEEAERIGAVIRALAVTKPTG